MGFVTAIDKAVNKRHYANEAQKERDHQAEMNQQFMDMLDKQMGEFDAQNAGIWGMVGQSGQTNNDIWSTYGAGGSGTTRQGSGGTGGNVPPATTIEDLMAMFRTGGTAGPNYDTSGNANFDTSGGVDFLKTFATGPNFDPNGNADFTGGSQNTIPKTNVDPYANVQNANSNTGGLNLETLWANAGVDNSWRTNSGAMYNLNDLIGYFDAKNAEKDRPSVFGTNPTSSTSPASDEVTLEQAPAGGEQRSGASSGAAPIEVKLPSTVPPEISGEIENLALKLEDAVANGLMTQEEAERLIRDLEGRATGLDGAETSDKVAVENGRVWGDPHFVCADGGKFDVQGEAGKTYNILSDRDLQVNAQFDEFGGKGSGLTTIGQVGITLGEDQVQFGKDGTLTINGEKKEDGTYLDGAVTLEDGKLTVKEDEFRFEVHVQKHPQGDHLNIENIRSENANADRVLPSGLWGGTVDGDGKARNGDAGKGTQGGGAIEDVNGNITKRGDKDTVKTYEVDGLFDTKFENHNEFAEKPDPAKDELAGDIDRISQQLDKLEGITMQANEVLDEIDMREERGQISPEAAQQARADIMDGLEAAKDAVLKPGDENSIFGKDFSNEDILGNVMSNLNRIDSDLNKLAKSTESSNTVVDGLRKTAESAGNPDEKAEITALADKIEVANLDVQLKTLEWT